jgi:beta-N-acetylhexosaminidase
LICNAPDKADQLLNGLEIENWIDARLSSQRIASLVPSDTALDWDALQEDVRYRAAKQTAQSLATT